MPEKPSRVVHRLPHFRIIRNDKDFLGQTLGGHFQKENDFLHTMEKIVEKGEHGEGIDIIHKFITDPNVEHEYIPESGQRKGFTDRT